MSSCYDHFVNSLYVYPLRVQFQKYRNICCKVELRLSDASVDVGEHLSTQFLFYANILIMILLSDGRREDDIREIFSVCILFECANGGLVPQSHAGDVGRVQDHAAIAPQRAGASLLHLLSGRVSEKGRQAHTGAHRLLVHANLQGEAVSIPPRSIIYCSFARVGIDYYYFILLLHRIDSIQ